MLVYGRVKKASSQPFLPDFVRNEKIVLTFDGFFRETVHDPSNEHERIHKVKIMYYMEDDTIMVFEPKTEVEIYRISLYKKSYSMGLLIFRTAAIRKVR